MHLKILYQDEHLVAINKPAGLLVHRSAIARDATEFAVQLLRDQIGQTVYPVHRLDRKTSGVLLFALNPEMNRALQMLFSERKTQKIYHAIVRGYTPENGVIDYPLQNERGESKEAFTKYQTLRQSEIDVPLGKHATSRYSLVELIPTTGRFHQLRKHMAHIFHPIIGDRPHGCNKQNRLWKERWDMTRMLLHASSLSFEHPKTGEVIEIKAGLDEEYERVVKMLFPAGGNKFCF